ncbi:hypothetical protein AB7M56_000140 [Bradyrhizobium elkanii]|nr:hypothetical protein [Bradyrhizobium elkanii]MCS3482358.1 hypothetical protein [Bradyrhizobium elkanii]MCS3525265.1 hypothetical protein [Bradyrhizobium elkanii]MCS4075832.1 hypothetical protein [Bradyrhizobium elkanii]MCS4084920.1 hypothetical protein [Bradyrhizobium elkanii]
MAPVHLIKSQRCNLAGTHSIDRQQHQDGAIAHVAWSVCQSVRQHPLHIGPRRRERQRLLLIDPRAADRRGQARVTRPLRCCMAEKYPQRSRVAGYGGARPTLSSCTDEVVVDVAWSQVRQLSIGCRAPLKELSGPALPLLDRRWAKAPLVAHPPDVPIELTLERYLDYRLAPPSEISEPWPGNVSQSPSGRTSRMNGRALPHHLQQLLHAEALRGVWREQASCPQQLSALHPQRRERSSVIRAMLEVAGSLSSERSIAVPMIGGLGTQQALEHGERASRRKASSRPFKIMWRQQHPSSYHRHPLHGCAT